MVVSKKIHLGILSLLSIACFMLFIAVPSAALAADTTEVKGPLWKMDTPATDRQWSTDNARARVIIFRLQRKNDVYQVLPLNIFINHQYHASLLPEHQAASLLLCAGKSSLLVRPGNRKSGLLNVDAFPTETTPALKAGNIYFYQVAIDDTGKMLGRWVDAAQAKKYLDGLKIQSHTLSRVGNNTDCPAEVYSINSSALFKFARADKGGLQPGASTRLNSLAQNITRDFETVNKIVVNGFADPMGNIDRNQRLSAQRAKTVASYLIDAGFPVGIIISQGLGSTKPIITDCSINYTRQIDIVACNQPNRRVEVEVYGVKNAIK